MAEGGDDHPTVLAIQQAPLADDENDDLVFGEEVEADPHPLLVSQS